MNSRFCFLYLILATRASVELQPRLSRLWLCGGAKLINGTVVSFVSTYFFFCHSVFLTHPSFSSLTNSCLHIIFFFFFL